MPPLHERSIETTHHPNDHTATLRITGVSVRPRRYDEAMPNTVDLLDRPTYGYGEVDRLLHLRAGTAKRWIDGYTRGGKQYAPVVREHPTDSPYVTWGEFVETRYLSEFRNAGVSMQQMRPAVALLRQRFQTKYPLAHARPFTDGRDLVLKVQEEVGLDHRLSLVVVASGQLKLSTGAQTFYSTTEFDPDRDNTAVLIRPSSASASVTIDPYRNSGSPVVRGVKTEVLIEQFRTGEDIEAIAETFDLTVSEVEDALRYEAA